MKYKDFFSHLLTESMTLTISGEDYDSRDLENMLGLSFKLSHKIIYNVINKLPDDKVEYFRNNRSMDFIAVDDGAEFKPVGTFNVYTSGLDLDTIKKVVEAFKYYASELDLTLGSIRGPEKSKMFKSEVIRIPVLKNGNVEKKKAHPPEVQLSNRNARLIFSRVLGYSNFDEGYSFAAVDLLKKVEEVLKKAADDEEFLYRYSSPQNIDQQPGRATIITGEISPEYILMRLNEIKELCQYAIDNGNREVHIS